MIKIKILFVLLGLYSVQNIYAQDTHYWSIQYGTKSTLLGGAVIGSVSDLSASYYNPGAIALIEDQKFVLTAKVYEYISLTVKDAAKIGEDLTSSSMRPSPPFVAFAIKLDSLGKQQLVFSALTRQQLEYSFATRRIEPIDLYPDQPGNEDFAGGASLDQSLYEGWFGISYSFQASDNIGIGATGYLAYREQTFQRQNIINVLDASNISSLTLFEKFEYQDIRTLLKFGMGFDFRPLTFGFTVTTPSINLFGSGATANHFFLNGVDLDDDNIDNNIFESNYQEELDSEYRSSWAIGFGGSYRVDKFRFHISGEWFDKVDQYNVLDIQPYHSQSSGEIIQNRVDHELNSVFNYGFGLDYLHSEKLTISLGFVTDFSASVPNSETNLTISKWDIYHIAGGISFPIRNSDLAFGLSYSFGSDEISTKLNLAPERNDESRIGQTSQTEVTAKRIKILVGFNF